MNQTKEIIQIFWASMIIISWVIVSIFGFIVYDTLIFAWFVIPILIIEIIGFIVIEEYY